MAEDKLKRGKVTPENVREAQRLSEIWHRRRAELRAAGLPVITQAAFGEEFDIGNQSAVGFFLNGKTALSFKAASGFARGLGCRIADFSPRLALIGEAPAAAVSSEPKDAALQLALAFSELQDEFADGKTKVDFYNELLGLIHSRPHRPKASAEEQHPESQPTTPQGQAQEKRRVKGRVRS